MPENQDKTKAGSAQDSSTSAGEEKTKDAEEKEVKEVKKEKEASSSAKAMEDKKEEKEAKEEKEVKEGKEEKEVKEGSPSAPASAEATAGKKATGDKKEEEKKAAALDPNKKKILIAEDERPLAHALELKFAHEGYATAIAKDGEEAMNLVKEINPDVILLDLIMPKVDGFAFLEAIKETGNKAPIIVLSNLGQEEDIERAKSLGVKGYFVKSNTPITDIVKEVKAVL